jgi:hypothetical protein
MMNNITKNIFCNLTSKTIAELIRNAEVTVCYSAPSIQIEPAQALVDVSERLGVEMLTVSIDFDERTLRFGYGTLEAIHLLREAGIVVNHADGIRQALLIIDDDGYSYTPTALYLEAENTTTINALRLSPEQTKEALTRLAPAAKAIAIAQATTVEEKERLSNLPIEITSTKVDTERFNQVDESLKQAPPVKFDVTRQVRVFEPYFQYVELSLTGVAIQRHKLAIPVSIQKLGEGKELEGRLKTTFDLIGKDSTLSSKSLEKEFNDIREDFTKSLGKNNGRILLKAARSFFEKELIAFQKKLEDHQGVVKENLQTYLDQSQNQIVDYYKQKVIDSPPNSLLGQLTGELQEKDAELWLNKQLAHVFPKADEIINEMKFETRFKDVTFETLNQPDFLTIIKEAYPGLDWDKPYDDFIAAKENTDEKLDSK